MNKKIKLSAQLVALGVIALLGFSALPLSPNKNVAADFQPWADNTSCDSATLHGHVEPNGASTDVWFEWGTSPSLGNRTPAPAGSPFSTNSTFSYQLTNLSPNTTYFFRAMASNENGTATGATLDFFTQCSNNNPTIVNFNFLVKNSCDNTAVVNASTHIGQDFGNGQDRTTDGNGFSNFGVNSNTNINWSVSASGYSSKSGTSNSGNSESTVNVSLTPSAGCTQQPPQNTLPQGYLDGADCNAIWGWSVDFNETTTPVHIEVDDVAGRSVITGLSNLFRSDVNAALGLTGNHAFNIATPTSLKDGTPHVIYVYGVDVDSTGTPTGNKFMLIGSPKTITCGNLPPTDVCPNIQGTQTSVPPGMHIDNFGNCVDNIIPPTDVCPNIPGTQTSVPSGMHIDNFGNCVDNIIPPTDVCPNIPGTQTSVPSGMHIDNFGNCVDNVTDVCPNIPGTQTSVPSGMHIDNFGNCVDNTVSPSGDIVVSPHSCTISANQSTCTTGATWTTTNASSPRVVDRNTGAILSTAANQSSPFTVWVAFPQTTYDLKDGNTNLDSDFATASCASQTSWNGSFCAPINGNAPVVHLTVDQNSLNANNGGTTVRWNPTNNPTSCTATGGTNGWAGPRSTTSSSFPTGQLSSTVTFSMTCSNSFGTSPQESVTVVVGTTNTNVTVSIWADDTDIDSGDSTRVHWSSTGANYCDTSGGSNGWAQNGRGTSGTFNTGSLSSDKTYRITCFNNNGDSDSDSVTVNVNDNNNDSNTRVTITADRTNINSGDSTIVRWRPIDATSCYGSGGANGWSGSKSTYSNSFNTGSLYSTTTFTINCSGRRDSDSDSVTIVVGNNQVINNNQPTVVLYADKTSVPFNGSANVSWITTNATSCFASGGSVGWAGTKSIGPASFYTGSLTSGKTFTLTCTNASGSATDSVFIGVRGLVTRTSVTPTSYVVINSSVDRNQPIIPTLDNTRPHPGDEINYTVTYQNIGNASITGLTLHITLPYEVEYLTSSPNNPIIAGNNLTFNLGTLRANGQGTVTVRVRVRLDAPPGALLNFPAVLTYIDPSGNLQSVNANVEAQVWTAPQNININGTAAPIELGAGAFGAGFLPTTLFGWLILFILVLVMLWLARYLYSDAQPYARRVTTTTIQH
jgi:uncharacterized repeat protein (TIGR01451 family)